MVWKDFFLVSKTYLLMDTEFNGNAPIHLIDFRISHSPEPIALAGSASPPGWVLLKPWGLLNDPSVIIRHLKPLVPCSGAINNQIKPQNKHTISSIN